MVHLVSSTGWVARREMGVEIQKERPVLGKSH